MDTDMIYMSGNGKILGVYAQGDLIKVFGPPYSSPSVFECKLMLAESVTRHTVFRQKQVACWTVELEENGNTFAAVTDFAYSEAPCLVRRVTSTKRISLRLQPFNGNKEQLHYETVSYVDNKTVILFKTKNGNPVYNDYPLPFPQFFNIIVRGDAEVKSVGEFTYDIAVQGTADIIIVGGPSYPECDQNTLHVTKLSYEQMLEETKKWWAQVFGTVTALDVVPANMPRREELIYAIESTVINILVQQGTEGSVIAGEPFPLGYVRDQYGVCMCMLKLGLHKQARKMLQFYIAVYRHNGCILNAQGVGVKGLFHFAENDKTEITGYLLLQFFKYAQLTGDYDVIRENIDFLYWLYLQQETQIHNGMLPFNGDETYIAGGLLPRDVLNDGSAEATMLFVLSGHALIDFLQTSDISDKYDLDKMENTVNAVEKEYLNNFIIDGKYTLNNPRRLEGLAQPEYRYGVCLNMGIGDCDFFGWTKLCEGDVYLCPKCISHGKKMQRKYDLYHLPSALLLPAYVSSPYPGKDIITGYLQELVDKMKKDGYVYSDDAHKKNIGYDYGLLLYNLVLYDMDGKEMVYNKVLDLMDDVGTWSERYIESRFDGVRFRPWESGINVDALIEYAIWLGK